jgi:curli production assembly/transport component CsgG
MQIPLKALLLAACVASLGGCAQDPLPSAQSQVLQAEAIALPPAPKRALNIGVYNCIDTTGQRRPTGASQELSSAVPMDCTPYIIDAVRSLTPGYVFLVERQHVDELLRERQLATLALNSNAKPGAPPPRLNMLRVVEVLLVGQVVAYDRQTRQLSAGVALGGAGITGSVVTDLVTFSLRAVAVQTGEVLGQSIVTKSITSQDVGGHLSRVFPTTILDVELGGGVNEPVGLAMREAVRGALMQLVDRGIHDGWWS